MADLNLVVLQGRLCGDPELKQTQSGKSICTINIAVNSYSSGANKADFFGVTCWEKTANLVATYFKKGSQILVRGRLSARKYEKDGAQRVVYEVTANEVCFCGAKADNNANNGVAAAPAFTPAAPQSMPQFEAIGPDEDLPF